MILRKIYRRIKRNYFIKVLSIVITFIIFVFLVDILYIFFIEWKFYYTYYIENLTPSNLCEIPMPNPFDDSVMIYAVKKKPIKCVVFQPELTYMDYQGILHLNHSAVFDHKLNMDSLKCHYRTFRKSNIDDNHIDYDPIQELKDTRKIDSKREFLNVTCYYKETIIYRNCHFYVPRKESVVKNNDIQPRVFILVIESMSRLNVIRHMPKTYSYLTQVMKSVVLKGLTKVADNSFPNIVPVLTGRRVFQIPEELPGKNCSGPYDDWPFIWRNFSNSGYVTAFTEDNPEFTLFNYVGKGFNKQPTDFYPRPLWLSLFQELLKPSSDFCLGRITSYNVLFDWIKQFIIKHKEDLYFLFSFYVAISHNDFNDAQLIDNDILMLLKDLNERKYFENTIVIMMGDHGNRYGKLVQTHIGRIEERMPFFSVALPSALDHQHPHLRKYLKNNSERLTSWLDIHSLLMDVVTSTYEISPPLHVWNSKGFSPWRMDIPEDRTCEEAGVPDNYCVCEKEVQIPIDDQIGQAAAHSLVSSLNVLLKDVNSLCSHLSLKKILRAVIVLPNRSTAERKGYTLKVRVMISLDPSDAVVESLLQKTAWSTDFEVIGTISRLNKYGNQSACIKHREMRKFCYCQNG